MQVLKNVSQLKSEVDQNGFAILKQFLPHERNLDALGQLGTITVLPDITPVQSLVPEVGSPENPNSYSGNFGIDEFPYHTDLAHWYRPPRYFALRCVRGFADVPTRFIDSTLLRAEFGDAALNRALVSPRRPHLGFRSILRLLELDSQIGSIFRWDSLFIKPASRSSGKMYMAVSEFLTHVSSIDFALEEPGDTVVIDNWRMIHGRSPVKSESMGRQIVRAYFGELA